MTQAQAYKKLNWPLEGRGFILPVDVKDDRVTWRAYHCDEGPGYSLISVDGQSTDCPDCGKPMKEVL